MDRTMSDAMDRWITGNYGEDQFRDEGCSECGEHLTSDDQVYFDEDDYPVCKRCYDNLN